MTSMIKALMDDETSRSGDAKTKKADPQRPAPFMKWAGGKRKLLPKILPKIPGGRIEHYVEAFVGGGALFFDLSAQGRIGNATLVDANEDLTRAYLYVKNDVDGVIVELRRPHDARASYYANESNAYYEIRALDPSKLSPLEAVARTIYMNRVGFNGLYRVNKSGGFNVPFGRYENPTICDEVVLRAASVALQRAKIHLTDFEFAIDVDVFSDPNVRPSDVFVYYDPPYLPISATSDFTSYTQDGFSLGDHERLRDHLLRLRNAGVRFVLSNSNAPAIRSLYDRPEFVVEEIDAARAINSDATKRGNVKELLVTASERT